jgi:hypothetical protein
MIPTERRSHSSLSLSTLKRSQRTSLTLAKRISKGGARSFNAASIVCRHRLSAPGRPLWRSRSPNQAGTRPNSCEGNRTGYVRPSGQLRVPAADIEDTVVKFLKEHLVAQQDGATPSIVRLGARSELAELVAGIVVHRDRLIVRFKSHTDEGSDSPDDRSLTIPWQKPPSRRSRQILLPHNASRNDVRPEQFERRARLVSAIARGRRWLDDVVSGRVTTVAELCAREKCSARQVNMAISLAFLAPNLVKAAVEGRLPRGIGVERLRDPPTEWSRQFDALGLNPE